VLQGNRFFGMHWFYRPEDTCLLVDKDMVKQKAKELAKADLAAWTKEKARCKAEKVPPSCLFMNFRHSQHTNSDRAHNRSHSCSSCNFELQPIRCIMLSWS
jgi:hypothetical protein